VLTIQHSAKAGFFLNYFAECPAIRHSGKAFIFFKNRRGKFFALRSGTRQSFFFQKPQRKKNLITLPSAIHTGIRQSFFFKNRKGDFKKNALPLCRVPVERHWVLGKEVMHFFYF
jgi:hypothetical protein